MEQKKKALGRGLEQLFSTEVLDFDTFENNVMESATESDIKEIPVEEIRSNPYQPRKTFDQQALEELASSIKVHGVFQPIIVKKSIKGYDLVAGERRLKASKLAGLTTIPAIDSLNITQDELAVKIGKSRSHVTNTLGLLNLPNDVQDMILNNKISMGHARVLSKMEDNSKIEEYANKVVKENISVRDLEDMASNRDVKKRVPIVRREKNNNYGYIEEELRELLGTKVKIGNRKIEINFNSDKDLDRILDILNVKIN